MIVLQNRWIFQGVFTSGFYGVLFYNNNLDANWYLERKVTQKYFFSTAINLL